jgi:hypothetical protein
MDWKRLTTPIGQAARPALAWWGMRMRGVRSTGGGGGAATNTGLGLSPGGTGYTGSGAGVWQAAPPGLPHGMSVLPGLCDPGSGTPLQFGNDGHRPVGSLLVAGLSEA